MESHVSAARAKLTNRTADYLRTSARRLYTSADVPICLGIAGVLVAAAFIAKGGLQLGSSTLVEVAVILLAAAVVGVALVLVGFQARLHGGLALTLVAAIGGYTGLSILWSLFPSDSWVETNRTLAYVGAFATGIAAVRIARGRWQAILSGVLLAMAAISAWALATKIAPAWLAPDEIYARLREPYGYWNAVGLTAAMGLPLVLWMATREHGSRAVNALGWPLLSLLAFTVLLSFSRGSIVAAVGGIAVWLTFAPLRLRSLAVLVPSLLAAALVTVWAFTQGALTDDHVALADRKHAGVELGLILVGMIVVLFAAGLLIQLRAERHPFSPQTRRKIGVTALAILAAAPLIGLGGLALTQRGITGTISDRWHDLTTANAATIQNRPSRLVETANVRTIYWRRAIDVWKKHPVKGAGAGSFAEAQLRFRREPANAKHAHGYVLQTMADLGLIGLLVSLVALGAWLLGVRDVLDLRRGRVFDARAEWGQERIGLLALTAVVVVFGVHSALDWTWFVPALAVTGLFCAGWLVGRGPLEPVEAERIPVLAAVHPSLPGGTQFRQRLGVALGLAALAVIMVLAAVQPWRSSEKGDHALRLAEARNYPAAEHTAGDAKDLNPLSTEPYFDLAAIAESRGDQAAGLADLQRAVQLEPSNPEAWQRLGDLYLYSRQDPVDAIPVLRAALFLDPLSASARASFLTALRAEQVLKARAAEANKASSRQKSTGKGRRR